MIVAKSAADVNRAPTRQLVVCLPFLSRVAAMSLYARPGGLLAFWDGSRVGQNAKRPPGRKKTAVGVFTHRLGPRERPHRTKKFLKGS